jgi:SAM-dependent methyltransferase
MERVVYDPDRPDLGGNVHLGDAHTFAPRLWRYLVDRFAVRSVLDVGCGEGHAVLYFHRMGIFAHGIDGSALNVARAVAPITRHDLLAGPYIMPVDLVWSCEVAEHIAPERVDHYLDTLTNGRIVAMTHAVPGQRGHNHVNCQWPEYWIDHMHRRGYSLSPENRLLRDIAGRDEAYNYFQVSGLVFLRRPR